MLKKSIISFLVILNLFINDGECCKSSFSGNILCIHTVLDALKIVLFMPETL